MSKIKRVDIDGETVYLRNNSLGWKVVYPYQKEYNNGKFNLKHFIAGRSWWNLVFVAGIVLIIILSIKEYYNTIRIAEVCLRALPDNINLSLFINNPELTSINLTGLI